MRPPIKTAMIVADFSGTFSAIPKPILIARPQTQAQFVRQRYTTEDNKNIIPLTLNWCRIQETCATFSRKQKSLALQNPAKLIALHKAPLFYPSSPASSRNKKPTTPQHYSGILSSLPLLNTPIPKTVYTSTFFRLCYPEIPAQ